MSYQKFIVRISSFAVTLLFGIVAVDFGAAYWPPVEPGLLAQRQVFHPEIPCGAGLSGGDFGPNNDYESRPGDLAPSIPKATSDISSLKVLSKPKPSYTDEARQNGVEGTVILRVTFLASRHIGTVSVVKGLPYGLTERAVAAARNIQFDPVSENGRQISVTKQVEYTFSIY